MQAAVRRDMQLRATQLQEQGLYSVLGTFGIAAKDTGQVLLIVAWQYACESM
jgi:hypothetical protein